MDTDNKKKRDLIRKQLVLNSFMDRLVAVYFVYNTLSVIWLLKSGMPVRVYASEFAVSVLPILFYYVGRRCRKRFLLAVVITGLFGIVLWLVSNRTMSFNPFALGGRSEKWIAAVNNMYSTWFGNGIGANGQAAIGLEDAFVVTDGGLVKAYCEQGIFGFSMFLYILILSFKKGFGNIRKYGLEVGIVALVILLAVGTDILSFPLVVPIFWFAIGYIHTEEKQ
jgi:hypothetical protein